MPYSLGRTNVKYHASAAYSTVSIQSETMQVNGDRYDGVPGVLHSKVPVS